MVQRSETGGSLSWKPCVRLTAPVWTEALASRDAWGKLFSRQRGAGRTGAPWETPGPTSNTPTRASRLVCRGAGMGRGEGHGHRNQGDLAAIPLPHGANLEPSGRLGLLAPWGLARTAGTTRLAGRPSCCGHFPIPACWGQPAGSQTPHPECWAPGRVRSSPRPSVR